MTFDEIAAALNEKELSFSADEIVMMAVAASTREEYIDCNFLRDIMSGLQKVKKTAMEDFKEIEKEMKKSESAKQADIGKAYLSTLKVGDPIQWMVRVYEDFYPINLGNFDHNQPRIFTDENEHVSKSTDGFRCSQ